jgi:hypothetical protein
VRLKCKMAVVCVAVPIRAKRRGIDTLRTEPWGVPRPRSGSMHETPLERLITAVHLAYR